MEGQTPSIPTEAGCGPVGAVFALEGMEGPTPSPAWVLWKHSPFLRSNGQQAGSGAWSERPSHA